MGLYSQGYYKQGYYSPQNSPCGDAPVSSAKPQPSYASPRRGLLRASSASVYAPYFLF
jgi:hypothetical protein